GDLKPVSIDLDPFMAGRTNAALHFTQAPGANGKLSFSVSGASFDVSGLSGGNDPERSDPRPKNYNLKLGKLYTSATGLVTNVTASAVRDPKGWSQISLKGLTDGTVPLAMDLEPYPNGTRNLLIKCDDFGKALKGLGFTDTVKGGKLKISGSTTP